MAGDLRVAPTLMDNLTHSLTAVIASRALGKRAGPYATGILVLASNAPDIDIVPLADSSAAFLHYHRGFTHSLAFAPVLALAVVGVFALGRRLARSSRPFPLGRALLLALAGVVVLHLLLDWATCYGMRLLWPFSSRWLAWDAIPIVDVWLLAALAAGLAIPHLFRLISEEIGERRSAGRGGAFFALAFLAAWFGFRGLLHARAEDILNSHLYRGLEPRQVGAFADIANPFLWHGVVETSETWELAPLNLLEEFDSQRSRTHYPPEPSAALQAAQLTATARIFLDFARFPYGYVEPTETGYKVVMRDLRFDYNIAGPKGFVTRVELDSGLRPRREDFRFRPAPDVR